MVNIVRDSFTWSITLFALALIVCEVKPDISYALLVALATLLIMTAIYL
jgi:hypothetical protein